MRTQLSLVEAVADVRNELRCVAHVLEETLRENDLLRAQLASQLELPAIDLDRLRRKIILRCHPDHGGSTLVMQEVIRLFDFLTKLKDVSA